jgi:hypothetical protein
VGTVAASSPAGQGSSGPSQAATIPVDVTMLHPAAAGSPASLHPGRGDGHEQTVPR